MCHSEIDTHCSNYNLPVAQKGKQPPWPPNSSIQASRFDSASLLHFQSGYFSVQLYSFNSSVQTVRNEKGGT